MPEVIPENERPAPKRKNRAILIAVILGIGLLGVAALVALAGVFVSVGHGGHTEYGERVAEMPEMPAMPEMPEMPPMPEMAEMPEMADMPEMPEVVVRTPAVGVRFDHHSGFFAKSVRSAFAALIILAGIYLITRSRVQRVETVPPMPVTGPEADRPRE